MIFIGVDISKKTFDVTILNQTKSKHGKFDNSDNGFIKFNEFIKSHKLKCYICMEATSIYGANLAQFLVKHDYKLIIANPFKIKSYSRMQMNRNKTDKADSFCIASYCKSLHSEGVITKQLYKPKSKYYLRLQCLVTRLEQVKQLRNQEINHLESALDKPVAKLINLSIRSLDRQIKSIHKVIINCIKKDKNLFKQVKLLTTIDGIGELTAWSIIAYLGDISSFLTSRQVVSFAGLNPFVESSGTSVDRASLSKMGNKRLRKALYMPAIVAKKHNPILAKFYNKLVNNGKPKKVALCAVMRKLLVLSFGVLKSGIEFDPKYKAL